MNLPDRDKRALAVGAALVLAILLVGYVMIPIGRKWSESRSVAGAKREFISTLAKRLDEQEATLKQRNALVLRMGSLFGPGTETTKRSEEKAPVEPENVPANNQESEAAKPDTKQESGNQADKPKPGDEETKAAPEISDKANPKRDEVKKKGSAAATLAGYVEQSAKQAGATIKRITPRKSSAGLRNTKYFHPVTLQVTMECTIQNLVKVLYALEKGERFVNVDQIQIHRDTGGGDRMDVTLDLRSYEAEARPS